MDPLSFTDQTPYFHSLSAWTLNAATGAWSVAPENNFALNPTFEADRISVTTSVGWTSANGTNSNDSRTGRWSWQLDGNGSLAQTVADQSTAIPAGTTWAKVTLSGIAVSDGRAEVGIAGGGQTVKADDFTLIAE